MSIENIINEVSVGLVTGLNTNIDTEHRKVKNRNKILNYVLMSLVSIFACTTIILSLKLFNGQTIQDGKI